MPDGPDDLDAALGEVRRVVGHARRTADGVVLGHSLGAEVDAIVAELARREAAGLTEGDRPALEALAARARRAVNRARQQARQATDRSVLGTAAIHLRSGPRSSR